MLTVSLFLYFLYSLLLVSQAYSAGTICDITQYGATPGDRDNGADVGVAIMKAYSECVVKTSGATLLIPAGKEFRMISHVNIKKNPLPFTIQWDGKLHLALLFQIPSADSNNAMFHFEDASHVTIQGSGTFEGYGPLFRPAGGVTHGTAFTGRPQFFLFDNCSGVIFKDIHLNNSPSFHVVFNGDNGHFSGITIADTGVLSGTTDGISLACHTCTVTNCHIRNGDDCVVVKSPSSNIQIDQIECHDGNGVGLGTVGPDGVWDVKDITFTNIKMFDTVGLFIKSFPGATGAINNIRFENVEGTNIRYMIWVTQFFFELNSPQKAMTWNGIHFVHITGTTVAMKKPRFLFRCNSQSHCTDITMERIQVTQLGGGPPVPNVVENAQVIGLPGP